MNTRMLLSCITTLLLTTQALSAQPVTAHLLEVRVDGQQAFLPGYAIGDVTVLNVAIADFSVSAGRREMTVMGNRVGTTTILVWDQQSRRRHELIVKVHRRLSPEDEAILKELLASFPSIQLSDVSGEPTLKGTVTSDADLRLVERIAARYQALVLVRVEALQPSINEAPPAKPRWATEYDIELLEAAVSFATATYGKGVEPSGRPVYRTQLTVQPDGTGQVMIGGVFTAKSRSHRAIPSGKEVGLRLTIGPVPGDDGVARTPVAIGTNLPIATGPYDPNRWRAFKDVFEVPPAVAFAIAGNELLAAPESERKPSTLDTIRKILRLPGPRDLPGVSELPVFGDVVASASYRSGQTQLLLLVRPRLVAPTPVGTGR